MPAIPGTSAPVTPRRDVEYVQAHPLSTPAGFFIEIVIGNLARQLTPETAKELANKIRKAARSRV